MLSLHLLRPRVLGVFSQLGDLVDRVDLGFQIHLLILLGKVILLNELGALDLVASQELKVSLYALGSVTMFHSSAESPIIPRR